VSDLLYLYGFVPADSPSPPPLAGIADRPVELLAVAGACAVISRVPADEYAAERIEDRLQQLDWVAAQGLAHEQVVAWFVDHADIAPAPLFTLYSGEDALAAEAGASADRIAAQLERCRGRREWNLKVTCDTATLHAGIGAASEPLRELDAEIAAAAPGRQFLLSRKRADLVRDEMRRIVLERADALLDLLAEDAEDTRRLPLPKGGESAVVLHAAVLVAIGRTEALRRRFAEEAARLEPLGIAATLSGPWAPYRFLGDAA
jgi:hypothetical protein